MLAHEAITFGHVLVERDSQFLSALVGSPFGVTQGLRHVIAVYDVGP